MFVACEASVEQRSVGSGAVPSAGVAAVAPGIGYRRPRAEVVFQDIVHLGAVSVALLHHGENAFKTTTVDCYITVIHNQLLSCFPVDLVVEGISSTTRCGNL